jgi:hypothetical protein
MAFCIVKSKIADFRKALKNKELDVFKLINMESADRIKVFEKFAGSEAKKLNLLFEQKLVLKNKLLGLKNLLSKVGELGKYSPEKQEAILQAAKDFKSQQMKRIFSPEEEESFLADLAAKITGTGVTRDEAKMIYDISTIMEKYKESYNPKTKQWANDKDRFMYGATKYEFNQLEEKLKTGSLSLKEMVKEYGAGIKTIWEENRAKAILTVAKDSAKKIADTSVSMVGTLDDSFMGRQGIKTLFTHPTTWWTMAKNSVYDFVKTLGKEDAKKALMADIYSRPKYLDGSYEKAGIFPKTEEAFPTSLPSRIPGLGRVFKASEVAFEGSAIRARADLFDLLARKA